MSTNAIANEIKYLGLRPWLQSLLAAKHTNTHTQTRVYIHTHTYIGILNKLVSFKKFPKGSLFNLALDNGQGLEPGIGSAQSAAAAGLSRKSNHLLKPGSRHDNAACITQTHIHSYIYIYI